MFRWITKISRWFMPPRHFRLPVLLTLGTLIGLAAYLMHISHATSYLSKDPKACMNCHVMTTAYATWQHSAHARVAKCADCHVPHDNIIHTYLFKAKDGIRHATIFTLGNEPQVIKISDSGAKAVQSNCVRCHENIHPDITQEKLAGKGFCWDCHRETPHGRVRSLSATPHAQIPELGSAVPDWFRKHFLREHDADHKNE